MMTAVANKTFDELTLGNGMNLEDLVDRDALVELVKSFYELFHVPLRIFDEDKKLLADAGEAIALYGYMNTLNNTRAALRELVDAVKNADPGEDGELSYPCISGAKYRIAAIQYDGRRIGRMILGPFVEPEAAEASAALLAIDSGIDVARVQELFQALPRAAEDVIARFVNHLRRTLDLILFSGHRSLLTTNMHLSSVRENFRELEDKNGKLQLAYDKLKDLDRLKSNFLATVSHELRTPLTSIIGYSEMLVEGLAGELRPEQREFIQTIRDKGDQLLQLIKSLLDLSKLESGTMSMRRTYADASAIMRDVVQTLAPTANKKQVMLTFEVESGLPQLWVDIERMRQVLLNLTENAVKFTPSGGRVSLFAKLVAMEATRSEDTGGLVIMSARRSAVQFRVVDTGIGIPLDERDRIFDAFYQVDSSSTREQGGTGLGLSIVKRLIDGHDGSVSIEDNTPQGSVFVVTIPLKRATMS